MRRFAVVAIAIATLTFVSLFAAGALAGSTPKTTGSVELTGPMQYVSFDAFESSPVKGSVSYTNFELAEPGTGAWVPDDFMMGFAVDPSTTIAATYDMTIDAFMPKSPTSVVFAGSGDSGVGWISTFKGKISGSSFTLWMTEINGSNPSETYDMVATGAVDVDGSVEGTWYDNFGTGRTGTFSIADVGHEVYHYVAAVTTASVTGADATFSFVIPTGVSYAGTTVPAIVHDGGSPGAGNDTFSFFSTPYEIASGNLSVFDY